LGCSLGRREAVHTAATKASPTGAVSRDDVADLVAVLSHEVAQPLTTALGCAQTLVARDQDLDEGDRWLILDILIRNLEQLTLLMAGLGAFGQISSGQMTLVRTPRSLHELCADAGEDFRRSFPSRNLDVDAGKNGEVSVDVPLFRQVLSNLLANAGKFSPPGSTVRLRAAHVDGGAEIIVSNEGDGFNQEDAERIFGKAVQLDASRPGSGIGLFVAKAVIEAHGGRVTAEGRPGEGATFRVFLPDAA
jgi:signal transduction histidine kinase